MINTKYIEQKRNFQHQQQQQQQHGQRNKNQILFIKIQKKTIFSINKMGQKRSHIYRLVIIFRIRLIIAQATKYKILFFSKLLDQVEKIMNGSHSKTQATQQRMRTPEIKSNWFVLSSLLLLLFVCVCARIVLNVAQRAYITLCVSAMMYTTMPIIIR